MRWRLTPHKKKLRENAKESSSLWIAYGLFTAAPGLAWSGVDILITWPAKKSTSTRNEHMQREDESVIGTNYHLGICSWFYLFFHISPVHPLKCILFAKLCPMLGLEAKHNIALLCAHFRQLNRTTSGRSWFAHIVLETRRLKM